MFGKRQEDGLAARSLSDQVSKKTRATQDFAAFAIVCAKADLLVSGPFHFCLTPWVSLRLERDCQLESVRLVFVIAARQSHRYGPALRLTYAPDMFNIN